MGEVVLLEEVEVGRRLEVGESEVARHPRQDQDIR